jgi:hypothetical protein
MTKPTAPRPIMINAILNGFEVTVGCATLAFTTREELFKELRRYLANPVKVEKEYMKKALYQQDIIESGPVNGD